MKTKSREMAKLARAIEAAKLEQPAKAPKGEKPKLVQMTIKLPPKMRTRLRNESTRRQSANEAGWQLQQIMLDALEAYLPTSSE